MWIFIAIDLNHRDFACARRSGSDDQSIII